MNRFRPFLFSVFSLSFFTITSVVLFYTFGYRFNFERGIFVYTGSISIKSVPEKVDITVDNELIPEKKLGILNQSIHIGGLNPGEHFIRVSAPGYSTWTKKVAVGSGLSTEFWNVLLLKEKNVPEILPETNFVTNIFQSRKRGIFALTEKKDSTLSVSILDTNTNTRTSLLSLDNTIFPLDISENIEWSPNNTHILVPTEQNNRLTYSIVNIETQEVTTLDAIVNEKEGEIIRNPRWDPANRDYILYTRGSSLYRINIVEKNALPILIKNNIRAYNFSGQDIYYLDDTNGIIYHLSGNINASEPNQITTEPLSILPSSDYTLILYNESRITVRENMTGRLFIYNTLSDKMILKEIAKKDVLGVQFSDDGKKLLFFTDNEISVYFVRDWETQPTREQDTILQIARFSTPIHNIVWWSDYEHILLSHNNTAKIIELDNRDQRNITDIATFSTSLQKILFYPDDNFLYFVSDIDQKTGTLSRIPLTETTNIFGF